MKWLNFIGWVLYWFVLGLYGAIVCLSIIYRDTEFAHAIFVNVGQSLVLTLPVAWVLQQKQKTPGLVAGGALLLGLILHLIAVQLIAAWVLGYYVGIFLLQAPIYSALLAAHRYTFKSHCA